MLGALEAAVTDLYDRLLAENGAILQMSDKKKEKEASRFRRLALECGSSNMGKSLAFSIIAIHVQALSMRESGRCLHCSRDSEFHFQSVRGKECRLKSVHRTFCDGFVDRRSQRIEAQRDLILGIVAETRGHDAC